LPVVRQRFHEHSITAWWTHLCGRVTSRESSMKSALDTIAPSSPCSQR
jgi:hypothetical protein